MEKTEKLKLGLAAAALSAAVATVLVLALPHRSSSDMQPSLANSSDSGTDPDEESAWSALPQRAPVSITNSSSAPRSPEVKADRLAVSVTDSYRVPVPGATVTALAPDSGITLMSTTTNSEGLATVRIDQSTATWIEAETEHGYGGVLVPIGASHCAVILARVRHVSVVVHDQELQPVAQVAVRSIADGFYLDSGITDESGTVPTLRVLESGTLQVEALGAEIERSVTEHELYRGEDQLIVEVERLQFSLAGTVYANGVPVVGAVVRDLEQPNREATTAVDGSFTLGMYAGSDSVLVSASHPDFLFEGLEVSMANASQRVPIELSAGHSVEVHVQGDESEGIADAEVTARIRTGLARNPSSPPVKIAVDKNKTTDESGRCTLSGIPSRGFDIEVSHPNFNRSAIRVEEKAHLVVIRLSRETSWRWRVVIPEPVSGLEDLQGWRIVMTPSDTNNHEGANNRLVTKWTGMTDSSGVASILQIAPGNYDAQVVSPTRRWRENVSLQVDGDEGVYAVPGQVVRLVNSDICSDNLSLVGHQFVATFFVDDSGAVCLSRPGQASIRCNRASTQVMIIDSNKIQWLDITRSDLGIK